MVRGIALFFLFSISFAKAVQVTAQVSPQEVQPEDSVVFTIRVSLEGNESVESPQLPEDLDVQSQSQSEQVTHSFSSISGTQKTINKSFQYYLISPAQEGLWTIDSASIQVGGKMYKTQPLKVTVSKNAKSKPQSPSFGPFDLFSNKYPPVLFPNKKIPSKENMKLKSFAPSRPVYLYERVPVEWFLYKFVNDPFSLNLTNRELVQPENFWTEVLSAPQDLRFTEKEKIGQKEYLKSLILSYVFFPLKTGKLTIDPLKIELQVINRNLFFALNFDRFTLQDKPLIMEVIPLPSRGRGEFTGAVGSFIISAQKVKKEIQKNDLLSYKILFEGEGLVQNIKLPAWPTSSDFKVYDILESQNFSAKKSWKEFEVLLSAKRTGVLQIPEFYWTTFDPELKSYVTQYIESQKVKVRQGLSAKKTEKESYLSPSNEASSSVPQKKYDIQPIDTHLSFYKRYKNWIWVSLYIFILLGILYKNRFRKTSKRNLKKIYQKAYQLCQQEQYQDVGTLLLNLVDQIWLEISGTGGRELEKLLEKCPPSMRHEFGVKIQNLVQNLENLSFAPQHNIEYQKKWNDQKVKEQIQNCEELVRHLLQLR